MLDRSDLLKGKKGLSSSSKKRRLNEMPTTSNLVSKHAQV
jgi:hypothetical protein